MSNPFFRSAPSEKAPGLLWLLGTPLALTTYEELTRHCQWLAGQPGVVALEFANTQIVTLRRHEPAFRKVTASYDAFIPDGMPLVWCLNRRRARLPDRVYGPTFMRRCISQSPAPLTHYLLGGSAELGQRLRAAIAGWNPAVRVVGSHHGRCRADGTFEESGVIDEINRLSPDFIWVGLGTPKQQAWTRASKARLRRGVVLTVGFAFDVNAGLKPDAPAWMQRCGLTWLARLLSEPGRLASRYLRYNSLFLFYLLWDGLRGRLFQESSPSTPPGQRV
jgi:N-acetylglucosaminyldiphosphoundecaprenol N-acetyl-beta-D-mannosaminyltransferase